MEISQSDVQANMVTSGGFSQEVKPQLLLSQNFRDRSPESKYLNGPSGGPRRHAEHVSPALGQIKRILAHYSATSAAQVSDASLQEVAGMLRK